MVICLVSKCHMSMVVLEGWVRVLYFMSRVRYEYGGVGGMG